MKANNILLLCLSFIMCCQLNAQDKVHVITEQDGDREINWYTYQDNRDKQLDEHLNLTDCDDISCKYCKAHLLSNAALSLENWSIIYDGNYYQMDYPMGDVPDSIGVCTDVVIRAYRKLGIDLQQLIHEDILRTMHQGLYYREDGGYQLYSRVDANIDHRRVPNLQTFFERNGQVLSTEPHPTKYLPGDIVTWKLEGGMNHIGVVVNQRSNTFYEYKVIHNIGYGQVIEDCLFDWKITGHYRY